MKQVDADQTTSTMTSDEQVSADYLLLHTALKAGEQQRRRQQSNALTVTTSDADRRRPSVPRLQVEPDEVPSQQLHRRTHSLKCPSSSPSPAARRQSTVRRAGSVKSTPPRSARNPSPTCRVPEREDVSRPVRRRSSAIGTTSTAAAAAAGGGAGGSNGCSRTAGSWRKLRRPRDVREFRDEYGGVDCAPASADAAQSLDDTIHSTLEQLRLIQDEDCCVVRCFNTTANGLVNRGDSFRRKNEPILHTSSSDGLLVGQELARESSRSRSQSSTNSHSSGAVPLLTAGGSEDARPATAPVMQSSSYTVLVLGQQGVGRTALLQQFMTSQFMAAETTLDSECDKTVSVLLDGLETTLSFVELPLPVQKDCMQYPEIEAYLVVFSLTDSQSFRYACDVLRLLKHHSRTDAAVILVGNKSDLVRGRRVSDDEARWMCRAMQCKYIQVSAALYHHVDDLLAGLVHQIRLNPVRQSAATGPASNRSQSPVSPTPRCFSAAKNFFMRLVGKNSSPTFDCDNLWTI